MRFQNSTARRGAAMEGDLCEVEDEAATGSAIAEALRVPRRRSCKSQSVSQSEIVSVSLNSSSGGIVKSGIPIQVISNPVE